MPTAIVSDPTLPVLAARFPLAAAVLSAHAHEGRATGVYGAIDAARIDRTRVLHFAIPSAL